MDGREREREREEEEGDVGAEAVHHLRVASVEREGGTRAEEDGKLLRVYRGRCRVVDFVTVEENCSASYAAHRGGVDVEIALQGLKVETKSRLSVEEDHSDENV